jgi:hypothetical protein
MTHTRLWLSFIWWYYGKAIKELGRNYLSLLSFLINFFSLTVLLRTLFSPFRRLHETQSFRLFAWQEWGSALIVNTLMRLVGLVLRLVLLVVGAALSLVSVPLFLVALLLWLSLPAILLLTLGIGLRLFFS